MVANAPHVPDSSRHETSRPVTGSRESDRSRGERGERGGRGGRGGRVDLAV